MLHATVECSNRKITPTLTKGLITPEILYEWELACEEYFRVKSVANDKQVESVLAGLRDFHIAGWARANVTELKILKFSEFMEKLREETLKEDWDRAIMLEIHDSKQRERPFSDWVHHLQNRNALLQGREEYHYDDALLSRRIWPLTSRSELGG